MTKGQLTGRIVVAAVLAAAVAWTLVNRDRIDADALEGWIQGFGIWGPALFIGLYALATVLFLPGSIFSLAGGMLFGPVWGTLYNLTGATIGATIAFLIARYLASDWVARKAGGRLARLIAGVEAEGWRFVAFVRLVPLFPFNLLNYALGLTRIRVSHYVLASFICMFPGGLAYTYLGYAGREAAAGSEGTIQKGLIALGILAAVAFLPRLVKRLRKAPAID
ncbi:MAG: TVP38/TMEM64 family protein [Alphaproteobacteria bacterium]|nr:TVP38/TMEM64 family protein [Alphaproteobacteria bacterium]